jgi:hypothetical protein
MNPEAEQQEPTAGDQPGATARPDADAATAKTEAKTAPKRRAGLPVWRTGKPDAFLAAAVDVARNAIEGITAASDIGRHLAAKSEGDRLVTHLFESKLPGYLGWQWYAVLTRNSRSKAVTVNELGLLPSEDSVLAPEWVPWAERVRPEDAQETESPGQYPSAPGARSAEPESKQPDSTEPEASEPGLPESELPESDLSESELPESDLSESELPESDLSESELPEDAPEKQEHGRAAADSGSAGRG